MTVKAKRRLTEISFDHEGAHLALVGPSVGGPANGVTTLVTKAVGNVSEEEIEKAKVKVTLDFEDFLCKFFGMWSDDAEVLAAFLGFERSEEEEEKAEDWWEARIKEKVESFELMKSLHDGKKNLSAVSPQEFISVKKAQSQLEPLILAVEKATKSKAASARHEPKTSNEGVNLETIEKSAHDEIVKAEVEKAVNAAVAAKAEELQKAADKVAELEKAAEGRKQELRKSRIAAVANPEKSEELLKSFTALDDVAFDVVMKNLEAAAKAVETTDLFKEQGADAGDSVKLNATAAILKSKYNK